MHDTSTLTDGEKRDVVLITGASSGLGAGMASEFAHRGYNLALCARRIDNLTTLRNQLLAQYPQLQIEIAALDVRNYNAVFTVFKQFRQSFKRIDCVVINAGIGSGAPVGKGGFEQNLTTIETNVCAALAQSEAAMEFFREQKQGHLVLVSSVSAVRGMRGSMTAYATSKAAVSSLAEGLRAETLRKPDIHITTLLPGYIKTEINANAPASKTPFIIDAKKGSHLLVNAIEARKQHAYIPWWPWAPLSFLFRILPIRLIARFM